ncbi:hypothetical protein P154DRAFT_222841 [Amniculicola lignicola CBS 123094]|uniref:Uncharacterized protein n=1 Tax=Amniculicola lignicola CBS 123094 TaxID=1392246 RepID=A0A6A5X1D5_9PLEO|nr:hypothetical protein P154DRAFT_222841 [Amniculicola lignicola CBS 123094]
MRRKVIHDFKAEIQDLARRYGVNYITTNIREQVWRKVCMNIGCWSCLVIADGVLLNSRYLEKSSRRMNARNRCTTPPPLDLPRNRVLVFVPLPSDLPQLTGIEEPQLNIYFALSCYLLGMAQWKQHDFGDAMISFELCIRTREKLIRGNDWDPTLAAAMDKFGLVASRWNHPGVERYRARHERMHHAVER